MHGEPIPYMLQTDWMVTCLILLSFIAMSWSVKNGKNYLSSHFKSFFVDKKRSSLFDTTSNVGIQYLFILGIVSCVMGGLYIYSYETSTLPHLTTHIPHYFLLFSYIGSIILITLFKLVGYSFINWIFFDKSRNQEWMIAYFDLIIFMSFLLFPIVLSIVYLGMDTEQSQLIILFVLILCKILLFYKCIRNFYIRIYGFFHIILYFCALEILPDLLLINWIDYLNSNLIIKFLVH